MNDLSLEKYNCLVVHCKCGFIGYLLYEWNKDGWFPDGHVCCRRCGKRFYISSCPQCRYGYLKTEQELSSNGNQIKCIICKEKFPVQPEKTTYLYPKIYLYEEIPEKLKKTVLHPKIIALESLFGTSKSFYFTVILTAVIYNLWEIMNHKDIFSTSNIFSCLFMTTVICTMIYLVYRRK